MLHTFRLLLNAQSNICSIPDILLRCLQKLLLQVMGHKRLLESHDDVMLLQKIQLRAPYVTPLNVLQVGSQIPLPMSLLPAARSAMQS